MESGSERSGSAAAATATRDRVLIVAGFVLHLVMGVVVLVSGLIVPPIAVLSLGVVWAAGLVVAILGWRRPWLVFPVPFVMGAIWLLTTYVGDTVFGWTA